MRVPVHGRVRKPQFSTTSPVLIFMILFTNHEQCMAYEKHGEQLFIHYGIQWDNKTCLNPDCQCVLHQYKICGMMQMQYNLQVTSTMPI